MQRTVIVGIVLFVVGVVAGRMSVATSTSTPTPAAAPGAVAPQGELPSEAQAGTMHGRVAEVLQVSQYTYLRLESGAWAAVEKAPTLEAGDEVTVLLQTEMRDFASPSLNRTFASLWFGTLEGAAPMVRQAQPQPVAVPSPDVKAALAALGTAGPLTLRVADVHSEKAALAGQQVKVTGTVDRVMEVQGKQYIHLKDGSGAAADKTDDLLVVSASPVSKGASVTLQGTVAVGRDLGMGPVPVMLDEAVQR